MGNLKINCEWPPPTANSQVTIQFGSYDLLSSYNFNSLQSYSIFQIYLIFFNLLLFFFTEVLYIFTIMKSRVDWPAFFEWLALLERPAFYNFENWNLNWYSTGWLVWMFNTFAPRCEVWLLQLLQLPTPYQKWRRRQTFSFSF